MLKPSVRLHVYALVNPRVTDGLYVSTCLSVHLTICPIHSTLWTPILFWLVWLGPDLICVYIRAKALNLGFSKVSLLFVRLSTVYGCEHSRGFRDTTCWRARVLYVRVHARVSTVVRAYMYARVSTVVWVHTRASTIVWVHTRASTIVWVHARVSTVVRAIDYSSASPFVLVPHKIIKILA